MTLMTGLTACDGGRSREQRAEREEARYQKAMSEYKAGNLAQAVSILEDVLRESPGNLSARFLLATLQQERKDSVGAFCNFREFTVLSPKGEKADMARSRLRLCEEQLARDLAKKMNLTDNAAIAEESAHARADLQTSEKSVARLTKDLAAAQKRVQTLEREVAQLRRMVGSVGADDPAPSRVRREDVKDILDDDEESARPMSVAAAKALIDDDDASPAVADGLSAAKDLAADAEHGAGPEALKRTEADAAGGATVKLTDFASGSPFGARKASDKDKDAGPLHEERPESYVVQEGDTLYKIAMRFYGSRNQWKRIREANKATISTDGRVKVGQKIVLP